jgi:hypothetical protein
MIFTQQISPQNGVFDLSIAAQRTQLASMFIQMAEATLQTLMAQLLAGSLVLTNYSWNRQRGSGLTKQAGIYVLVNVPLQKVYLGGTSNLAQRKGEYKSWLSDPSRHAKLPNAIEADIKVGKLEDFCFVPLVIIPQSRLTVGSTVAVGKEISKFLDLAVEQRMLQTLLAQPAAAQTVYNQKTVGTFVIGNQQGGSPQSGSSNKAVMFGTYAWESKSAAAKSLGKDRKTIRNYTDAGKFKEITTAAYEAFSGTRISNKDAASFFDGKADQLKDLKDALRM